MNPPPNPYSARSRGLTLVELLAGLVVLGTLLTCVVAARARFLQQWADADRKLTATRELDTLITAWLDRPTSMPRVPAEGAFPNLPDHRWQTTYLPHPTAADLSARILRVEVVPTRAPRRAKIQPLLTIDLLMRDELSTTQPARPTR